VLCAGLEAIRAIDEAMQRVRMEMKVGDVEEGALPPKLHTVLESTPEKKEGVVNPLLVSRRNGRICFVLRSNHAHSCLHSRTRSP